MVDAVVVTMDSREIVLRCLEHLAAVDHVIVVDNASRDGTAEAVASTYRNADVLRLETQQSLAAAYNRGAQAGSAEFILFLNDDVFAERSSIERLVRVLEDDCAAVAAAGRLVDAQTGTTQSEYEPRPYPGVGRFIVAFTGLQRLWPSNPWTSPHRDRPLDGPPVAVEQPAGACLLVRRSAFDAVNGWDEDFELWFEDTDFARRLSFVGHTLYVPEAPFRHVGGHSTRRLNRAEVVRNSYSSALRYALKHFPRRRQVALGIVFAVAAGARALVTRDRELSAVYRVILRFSLRLIRGWA